MYLLGSIALRLMAMTFLFPIVARLTLAAVRPGYLSGFIERTDFPYQVGVDVIFAIIGISLLFQGTARTFLAGGEVFAFAVVRAIVISALTGLAILRALHMAVSLGALPSLQAQGVMEVAIGFWTIFFALCVFPGWYGKRLLRHATRPAEPRPSWPAPDGARYVTLPPPVPAKARPLRAKRERAPDMRHMTLTDWLSTFVAFCLLSALAAGALHGISVAKFLPTTAHDILVDRMVWPLGIVCAVLLVVLVIRGPRPRRNSAFGSPFWRTVAAATIFYSGFYISAEPALRIGLPDAWAKTQGGDVRSVMATVVAREQDYRRHKCNHTALVVMDVGEGPRNYVVCDVPAVAWAGLKRGDRLRVTGVATPFGFRYEAVSPI